LLGVFFAAGQPCGGAASDRTGPQAEPRLGLNNRGVAFNELKRFDEALSSFERAVTLRPGYAEAHSNRGNVLKALRRFEDALAHCGWIMPKRIPIEVMCCAS
jgi:tetratricopeptide (TPR) repeat protein